jgi:hypothetical protein
MRPGRAYGYVCGTIREHLYIAGRHEDDLLFIVGEMHRRCPSVFAAGLSRLVSSLQAIDPPIREFNTSMKDQQKYVQTFLDFVHVLPFQLTWKSMECLMTCRVLNLLHADVKSSLRKHQRHSPYCPE